MGLVNLKDSKSPRCRMESHGSTLGGACTNLRYQSYHISGCSNSSNINAFSHCQTQSCGTTMTPPNQRNVLVSDCQNSTPISIRALSSPSLEPSLVFKQPSLYTRQGRRHRVGSACSLCINFGTSNARCTSEALLHFCNTELKDYPDWSVSSIIASRGACSSSRSTYFPLRLSSPP